MDELIILNLFVKNFINSINLIISQLIYSPFVSSIINFTIYLIFIKVIQEKENNKPPQTIINIFAHFLLDIGGIVESEEDANELAADLFHLKDPPIEKPVEEMNTPNIMSALMQDNAADPFDEERLAMARLSIQEVGHVPSFEDNIETKYYARNLKKEEATLDADCKRKLKQNDEENAQFKHGMGFRRPEFRHPCHLALTPFNVSIGPLTLIEDASLTLSPGNRYGLVGRNGLGKTTLMKYINSSLVRGVPYDLLIIHVEQEAPNVPNF